MPTHNVLERAPISSLRPYAKNARTHSKRQIKQIANSIERFGFTNPVLVDDDLMIIAGHGRVAAARLLQMESVPIVRLSHLSEAEKRAYIIADNRLAEKAGWDREILAIELQCIIDLGLGAEIVGFETAEIDVILGDAVSANTASLVGPEDEVVLPPKIPVSRVGDLWECGRHRLVCGDARDASAYARLMQGEAADMVFTDPPYNVPVGGHVRVTGEHREFAMASGEMSETAFTAFLESALQPMASVCKDGAIAFVCMDWRHMSELLAAGRAVFSDLKNVCVWSKTNGGMGSFYRSQHELVFVFKHGEAKHQNNIELGKFGRNRTNVWTYPGVNVFKEGRDAELAMHPTVKPVALVEDAIKDVCSRNQIVLDPFAGSGTTLIAAERSGRRGRLLEIDPLYCDVILRRFERYLGRSALLEGGATFEEVAAQRT